VIVITNLSNLIVHFCQMGRLNLLVIKQDVVNMKSELIAGYLTSDNCSIILKRILGLNKDIDRCIDKDEYYCGLVESCYCYYRMIDQYFY